jgi:hypothetical protein
MLSRFCIDFEVPSKHCSRLMQDLKKRAVATQFGPNGTEVKQAKVQENRRKGNKRLASLILIERIVLRLMFRGRRGRHLNAGKDLE